MFFKSKPFRKSLVLQEHSGKISFEVRQPRESEKDTRTFKRLKKSAKELALEFGHESTIHGINRIFKKHSNVYERSFWLIILLLALLGSIYVCLIVSRRFNAGSLQTVVDTTNKPVFHIPFPEVSICNNNHLNWARIAEAKERFMPKENNSVKTQLFEFVIGLYDNFEFGKFHDFNALKGKPLALVSGINFSQVYDFMTWRCEELLTDCRWLYYKVNCCDIFLKNGGLHGRCWHFNTLSTEEGRQRKLLDSKYPWRTGSARAESGLSLRVLLNQEKHYRKDNKKGILVDVHEPGVYYKDPLWIPANSETALEIDPAIYYYDNGTRSVPPAKRQCLFNDERSNKDYKHLADFVYMFENCEAQCRQEYLLQYCNCTIDLFFPYYAYPACGVEDLLCLAKHNDYFRFTHQIGEENFVKSKVKNMVCNCFRNCYSLNYIADVRPSFLHGHIRDNESFVQLDVHYRSEKFIVYRTSLVFNWVDLMVAFGGIAGLFLGCSLISAIEIIYFFLVELPVFLIKELRSKRKTRGLQEQQNYKYNDERSGKIIHTDCNWVSHSHLKGERHLQPKGLFLNKSNLSGKTQQKNLRC